MDLEREKDIEQLRKIAQVQQQQMERLLEVLAAQSDRIDELTGDKGELQRSLKLLERSKRKVEAAEAKARRKEEKERKKREVFGPKPQPELPVHEELFVLDAPDETCPECGGELKPFEGQYDESEMIDVVDVSYRIVRCKRQKYVCSCGGCVDTAPGPERAIKGGRYSLAFAAKVAIDKYIDHLPLTRQARIMKRRGLEVTSQTLWKNLHAITQELRPVYEALLEHILAQPVIGLDQTGWKRLNKKKKDTPYQMWCLTAPGAILHAIKDDKSADTFGELLADFEDTVVCDAMASHAAGARASPNDIVLAGCWAHVLRKFRDAAPNHPESELMLGWIKQLYELDAEAGDDLEARRKIRKTKSKKVIAKMKAWLKAQRTLTSLDFGKAAQYAYGNWRSLTRFLDDPRIPLDNNATERGIRGPVVGRKNHYGSKSRRGTEVASILYSLVETAKLHDLDPAAYLVDAVRAARLGEVRLPIA